MNDLERRLHALERRARATRLLVLALAAVAGLTAARPPQQRPQPRYLRVQGLEVTDARGRTVFRVGNTPAGGHVEVIGALGKKAFEVAATRSGAHLVLNGNEGKTRVRLSGADAGGQLELLNANARPAVIATAAGDAGEVAIRDDANRSIAILGTDEAGNGVLDIANVDKKKRRSFGF